MAYSQALVLAGGIAHVPILITALKFADNKTLKLHKTKEVAAEAQAQAKAAKEKAQKAEKALAEKALAAKAAAKAEAEKAAAQSSPPPIEDN